jgi:hypothetical protein
MMKRNEFGATIQYTDPLGPFGSAVVTQSTVMNRLGSIEQLSPSFVVFGGLSFEGPSDGLQGGQRVPRGGSMPVARVKLAGAMQLMSGSKAASVCQGGVRRLCA